MWLGCKGRYGSFHVDKCGWQVKLCDPSLTRANLSASEVSIAYIIKHYTYVLCTCFTCVEMKTVWCCRVLKRVQVGRVGAGLCSVWCSSFLSDGEQETAASCCWCCVDKRPTVDDLFCSRVVVQFTVLALSFFTDSHSCSAWILLLLFRNKSASRRPLHFIELQMCSCICVPWMVH